MTLTATATATTVMESDIDMAFQRAGERRSSSSTRLSRQDKRSRHPQVSGWEAASAEGAWGIAAVAVPNGSCDACGDARNHEPSWGNCPFWTEGQGGA